MLKRGFIILFLIILSFESHAQLLGGNSSKCVTVMVGNTMFSDYCIGLSDGYSTTQTYPKNFVAPLAGLRWERDGAMTGFKYKWHFQLLAGMESYGSSAANSTFFQRSYFVDPSLGFDLGWKDAYWALYASVDFVYGINFGGYFDTRSFTALSLYYRYDVTDNIFTTIQARNPVMFRSLFLGSFWELNLDVLLGIGFKI